MGVGTYRQDYCGSGRSINVYGPLGSDKEYASYREACKADRTDCMSREEYDRDVYDQANEDMLSEVAGIGRDLGFFPVRKGRFDGPTASFDRDVTMISSGNIFDFGWRSWQHDFVVAIGPSSPDFKELAENPEDSLLWAIGEKGRSPVRLKAEYDAVLDDIENLVRYTLMRAGLETGVPTSGYTSRPDAQPENIDELISELLDSAKAGIAKLERGSSDVIPGLSADERLELAKVVIRASPECSMHQVCRVLVATYDAENSAIALWDPCDEDAGLMGVRRAPQSYSDYLTALPTSVDGLASIPFVPETKDLYASLQSAQSGIRLVVSPEQYLAITSEPCVVVWRDDETMESGTYLLHETAPIPQAAP